MKSDIYVCKAMGLSPLIIHKKKRAFEKGHPAALTKVVNNADEVKVRRIRVRGGNFKFRALRL